MRQVPEGSGPTENGADGGRDPATGRFLPGNRGGPGAPFLDRVSRFRRLLVAAVSDKDLEEIVRTLVKQSKEGDLAAIKLLLPYLVGRPPEPVDDADDGGTKGPICIVLTREQADGLDREALERRDVHVVAVDEQDLGA